MTAYSASHIEAIIDDAIVVEDKVIEQLSKFDSDLSELGILTEHCLLGFIL